MRLDALFVKALKDKMRWDIEAYKELNWMVAKNEIHKSVVGNLRKFSIHCSLKALLYVGYVYRNLDLE